MTQLDVSSGFYTSSHGPGGFHITVNDPASTLPIMKLDLSAEQLAALLRGTTQSVEGELMFGKYPERIGKTMEHDFLSVPRIITSHAYDREQQENAAMEWAKNFAPDWDTYAARRTNAGTIKVIVRRWV